MVTIAEQATTTARLAELEARGDFIRKLPGEFFTVDGAEYIITDRFAGYLLQK